MSHGGFGGGGHGHSGGGHGHHGSMLGHGGGGAHHGGHHGSVVGHVLKALGLGHHTHHSHGVHGHGGHHPDQAPNWNQAMQAEKGRGWKAALLRADRRPFIMLFVLFTSSFLWLYVVYAVHHSEEARERAEADVPHGVNYASGRSASGSSAPAYSSTGIPAGSNSYNPAQPGYMAQNSFGGVATAPGAFSAGGPPLATGYGAIPTAGYAPTAAAVSPYGVAGMSGYGATGATGTSAYSAYGAPVASEFGVPRAAGPGYLPAAAPQGYGSVTPPTAQSVNYAPLADGRRRLVVSR